MCVYLSEGEVEGGRSGVLDSDWTGGGEQVDGPMGKESVCVHTQSKEMGD